MGKGKPIAHAKGKALYINIDDDGGDDQIYSNDELLPIMDPYMRNVHYIAGPAGSGKSTHASKYAESYKLLKPKNEIIVFSRLPLAPFMSKLGATLMPINEKLADVDPLEEMENCLTVFDDIDTIPDEKLRKLVYKIVNDILEAGRHKNIDVILTSHLINGNDRKNTKTILNEAHTITVFPKSGAIRQIKYLLKEYYGMDNKTIKEVLDNDSRWLTFGKMYPQYILYDHGAVMNSSI